jgi:hypothetical protein
LIFASGRPSNAHKTRVRWESIFLIETVVNFRVSQVVSLLPNADQEFTVQEVVTASKDAWMNPFTSSHVSQMLSALAKAGLVYKNRHGKYSRAAPLLG